MFSTTDAKIIQPKTINERKKAQFLRAFGEHIRSLRQERNLSQSELAARCNTNIRKIGRTERGEYDFKFSSLVVLAIGLELEIFELLQFDYPEDLYRTFWETEENLCLTGRR